MSTRQVPASVGQRLLWLMEHYRGDGRGMLNQPLALRMAGAVDMEALNQAYTELVRRHEALRTTFSGRGGRLTQAIHEPEPMRIQQIDLRAAEDPSGAAYAALIADLRSPVDPTEWPVRATAWRARDDEYVICLNMHHLVTDDWSCSVIARDLGLLYRRARGEDVTLPDVGWQFADWAQWQQRNLSGPRLAKLETYWSAKLAGARGVQLVNITSAAQEASREVESEARSWDVDIAPEQLARLRAIAGQERCTPYAFLLAAFYLQLFAETGQDDLAVSSIFGNRTRAEVAQTVGFFVNMVILRGLIRPHETFRDLLRQVRITTVEALNYQAFPYQMLPAGTILEGAIAPRDVVFQMLDANETAFSVEGVDSGELLLVETGRFPLELAFFPHQDSLRGTLFYHCPQFGDEWTRRLLAGCAATVQEAIDSPDSSIADIMAGAEKSREAFSATVMR
ncbi:MAG TPA: condensation protein [Micromonosporaceae bacterium]|nr:condensation protein [Micromonosporaceae bacterium]HCU49724.1 condensation protein [Micromonosporaceae bacterium]